jgi:methylmalonyl-CoA mutase cobalamin-binding subunit
MPVVVGGTFPKSDHAELARMGVRRVFTPADYRLVDIVGALVDLCS